jgi:hypothetical protein
VPPTALSAPCSTALVPHASQSLLVNTNGSSVPTGPRNKPTRIASTLSTLRANNNAAAAAYRLDEGKDHVVNATTMSCNHPTILLHTWPTATKKKKNKTLALFSQQHSSNRQTKLEIIKYIYVSKLQT